MIPPTQKKICPCPSRQPHETGPNRRPAPKSVDSIRAVAAAGRGCVQCIACARVRDCSISYVPIKRWPQQQWISIDDRGPLLLRSPSNDACVKVVDVISDEMNAPYAFILFMRPAQTHQTKSAFFVRASPPSSIVPRLLPRLLRKKAPTPRPLAVSLQRPPPTIDRPACATAPSHPPPHPSLHTASLGMPRPSRAVGCLCVARVAGCVCPTVSPTVTLLTPPFAQIRRARIQEHTPGTSQGERAHDSTPYHTHTTGSALSGTKHTNIGRPSCHTLPRPCIA